MSLRERDRERKFYSKNDERERESFIGKMTEREREERESFIVKVTERRERVL